MNQNHCLNILIRAVEMDFISKNFSIGFLKKGWKYQKKEK